LNKPQQDELEKLFTKIKESSDPKPVPLRVTKKQKKLKVQAEIEEICAKEEEEDKSAQMELDLAEEKDWLSKYDEVWSEEIIGLK